MDLTSILIVLIVGAVAGWLLPMVGVSFGGLIGSIIMSVIGAVILIFIIRLVRRAT